MAAGVYWVGSSSGLRLWVAWAHTDRCSYLLYRHGFRLLRCVKGISVLAESARFPK